MTKFDYLVILTHITSLDSISREICEGTDCDFVVECIYHRDCVSNTLREHFEPDFHSTYWLRCIITQQYRPWVYLYPAAQIVARRRDFVAVRRRGARKWGILSTFYKNRTFMEQPAIIKQLLLTKSGRRVLSGVAPYACEYVNCMTQRGLCWHQPHINTSSIQSSTGNSCNPWHDFFALTNWLEQK